MPISRPLIRTSLPGTILFPRLFLASLIAVGGLRALGVNYWLGTSRLADPPFSFSGTMLFVLGVLQLLVAASLAAGFLTRLMAIVPLVISTMIIMHSWPKVGTMDTSDALNSIVLSLGSIGVGLVLLFHGAGVWSVDASLSGSKSRS